MKSQNQLLLAGVAILLLVIGCKSPAIQQAEKNKQIFLLGVKAINNRNLDDLDDLIATNYVRHCEATPDVKVNSLEDFKQFLKQDAVVFPDSRMTIEHLVAEGNWVAFYGTYVGTQKGQMGPFPPSNKQISLEFSGVHRFENNKIVESWLTWDNLTALTQLGYYPPPMPQTSK